MTSFSAGRSLSENFYHITSKNRSSDCRIEFMTKEINSNWQHSRCVLSNNINIQMYKIDRRRTEYSGSMKETVIYGIRRRQKNTKIFSSRIGLRESSSSSSSSFPSLFPYLFFCRPTPKELYISPHSQPPAMSLLLCRCVNGICGVIYCGILPFARFSPAAAAVASWCRLYV